MTCDLATNHMLFNKNIFSSNDVIIWSAARQIYLQLELVGKHANMRCICFCRTYYTRWNDQSKHTATILIIIAIISGKFFLTRGNRGTDDVTCCTDCKVLWGNVIVIFGYIKNLDESYQWTDVSAVTAYVRFVWIWKLLFSLIIMQKTMPRINSNYYTARKAYRLFALTSF